MAVATVLLASFGIAAAQTTPACQIVYVEVSAPEVEQGTPVIFTAKLSAVDSTAKPEFKWQINTGEIVAGEGTSSITVSTDGLGGQRVEATVSVSGISTTCSTSATKSVSIPPPPPPCDMPFDEYGDISFEDEQARLDNFAVQLANFEAATAYLIAYAGKETYEGEATARLKRAKDYLVKVRGVEPARITTVDGGYRPDFSVSLIVVPPDAKPPVALPTLTRDEVQFTKPRPADSTKTKAGKRQ